MADRTADSIDTHISRLKFSRKVTLWRSCRLKYLDKKRNISEIKIGREYCFDIKYKKP